MGEHIQITKINSSQRRPAYTRRIPLPTWPVSKLVDTQQDGAGDSKNGFGLQGLWGDSTTKEPQDVPEDTHTGKSCECLVGTALIKEV